MSYFGPVYWPESLEQEHPQSATEQAPDSQQFAASQLQLEQPELPQLQPIANAITNKTKIFFIIFYPE
jgi:hypothetical protein